MDNPNRTLTIRLMVATAFLMLIALVGALASLGGDDTAAAWGKALLSVPIFGALFVFLYVVWKADLPRLWREFAETLERESDKTIKRESGKAKRQSQKQGGRAPHGVAKGQNEPEDSNEEAVRSSALPVYRSTASPASRYWVRLGTSRHQQLTPEEMAAELERLVPLAAQAEEAEHRATRIQEALQRLEAQRAEDEVRAHTALTQQAEALAAQWTAELIARWYGVLFGEHEVPGPDEAFEAVRAELERLRLRATRAESQATRLAAVEQTLQRQTDDLASKEQHLNTARQRLEAVREALGIPAGVPLVEGARQVRAELKRLAETLEETKSIYQERDTLLQQAETDQAALRGLQSQIAQREALLDRLSRLEELSEAEMAAFWGTVNYGPELIPDRWPRRIEQRFRAAGIFQMRLRGERTERTELARAVGEGGEPLLPSPPPPISPLLPATPGSDEAELPGTQDEEGGGEAPDAGSVSSASSVPPPQFGQFGQFGVRNSRTSPFRPRRPRRPSMGHY